MTHEIVLEKGARSREQEEQLISSAALHVLERALTAPTGAFGEQAHSIRARLLPNGGDHGANADAGANAREREQRARSASRVLCAAADQYRLVHSATRPAPLDRLLSGEAELVLCLPPAQPPQGASAGAGAAVGRLSGGEAGGPAPAGPAGAAEREASAEAALGGTGAGAGAGAGAASGTGEAYAWCDVKVSGAIIFPGSFNPVHTGHARMAAAAVEAAALAGKGERPVLFEITARNADKGAVDRTELQRRAAQFARLAGAGRDGTALGAPVVLTRASLFVDKSRLFPNCTFVVGADTVARLVNSKYYNGSEAEMAASLAAIRASGCDFLVAGRLIDGRYTCLEALLPAVPESLRPMFAPLREDGSAFRVDISSTELRQRAAAEAAAEAGGGAGKGAAGLR